MGQSPENQLIISQKVEGHQRPTTQNQANGAGQALRQLPNLLGHPTN